MLNKASISSKIDDTNTAIGRRYARTDEMGIPYAITVDDETVNNNKVTIRELDTMKQVTVPVDDVCDRLHELTRE